MSHQAAVRVGLVGTSWWAEAMYLPALADHPIGRIAAEAMTRGWVSAIAEHRPIDPDFATGARVQQLVAAAITSAATDGTWQAVL